MPTTYYLDTTIPLTRLFAPLAIRQRIDEQIETQNCLISRYVRMEYLRWLAPAVDLHRLLQQEIQRNPATALSETQARILLSFGRNQTKMLSLLTLLSRAYGHRMPQYML